MRTTSIRDHDSKVFTEVVDSEEGLNEGFREFRNKGRHDSGSCPAPTHHVPFAFARVHAISVRDALFGRNIVESLIHMINLSLTVAVRVVISRFSEHCSATQCRASFEDTAAAL
jgi:hypothetical protein